MKSLDEKKNLIEEIPNMISLKICHNGILLFNLGLS